MIEQTIESRITALISAALPTAYVSGFWTPAPEGETKLVNPPFIAVTVGLKANEGESEPVYVIPVSIQIVSPLSSDPRAAVFIPQATAVSALIDGWNSGSGAPARAALQAALGGTGYSVEGIADGGGDCGYDRDVQAWFAFKLFDLHVVI